MKISKYLSLLVRVSILAMISLSCSVTSQYKGKLSSSDLESGARIYKHLVEAADSADNAAVLLNAKSLINAFPRYPKIDEVYYRASFAAFSLKKYDQAARYALYLADNFPVSEHMDDALFLASKSYYELGEFFECMDLAERILASPGDPKVRSRAFQIQEDTRRNLSTIEMEKLVHKYPSSTLAEEISLDVAKKEFAHGDYDRAYDLLAELIYKYPQHKRANEIRKLLRLASERRTVPISAITPVDPYKIGAILPITGDASVAGRYFERGLCLALEEFNDTSRFDVSLAEADSKGSPFAAVKAARKLIQEEGVLALIGSVKAMPTITAAVEANAWGVPMLSPVITSGELSEIGPWVFLVRVPGEVEVAAIAELSAKKLLLSRFAVLAPQEGERKRLADLFVEEVHQLEGDVVSVEHFEIGATDFKEQLLAIRDAAPEAMFIPASPEELILILPQIRFYDLQAQLLGLSDWNSEKLLRLSRKEIEGAVFPLGAYHGENSFVYNHFLELHREKIGLEVDPLTASGYFGMRTILLGIFSGIANRAQARDFLYNELYGDARKRMEEAKALTILTVHDGKVSELGVGSSLEE